MPFPRHATPSGRAIANLVRVERRDQGRGRIGNALTRARPDCRTGWYVLTTVRVYKHTFYA